MGDDKQNAGGDWKYDAMALLLGLCMGLFSHMTYPRLVAGPDFETLAMTYWVIGLAVVLSLLQGNGHSFISRFIWGVELAFASLILRLSFDWVQEPDVSQYEPLIVLTASFVAMVHFAMPISKFMDRKK